MHGREIEVELAIERLADPDLFFDSPDTPQSRKAFNDDDSEGVRQGFDDDDDEEGEDGKERNAGDNTNHQSNANRHEATNVGEPLPGMFKNMERPQLKRVGSERRLAALELRKQNLLLGKMWKAHESGLAVTNNGSKQSLLARTSSCGSVHRLSHHASSGGGSSGGGGGRLPPSNYRVRLKNASETDIFRKSSTNSSELRKALSIPRPAHVPYGRSHSMLQSVPKLPEPIAFGGRNISERSANSSSRKSVTFQLDHDFDKLPRRASVPNPKVMRRSISDSIQYQVKPGIDEGGLDDLLPIPTEHPPATKPLAERSDSLGSIPSLRPATALRSDSMVSVSSVPSIHHARPIRSDSMGSIPSIRPAHPLRSESIGSIPSLHHANPLIAPGADTIYAMGSDEFSSEEFLAQQDARALLLAKYAAVDSIAAMWVTDSTSAEENSDSALNLPKNVMIPSSHTETTIDTETDRVACGVSSDSKHHDDKEEVEEEQERFDEGEKAPPLPKPTKPVLMRLASRNAYEGEGIEVEEMADQDFITYTPYQFQSITSLGDWSVRSCASFDESTVAQSRHSDIFRTIRKSLSDEDMSNLFLGTSGT